jgi:hypothetical protein
MRFCDACNKHTLYEYAKSEAGQANEPAKETCLPALQSCGTRKICMFCHRTRNEKKSVRR